MTEKPWQVQMINAFLTIWQSMSGYFWPKLKKKKLNIWTDFWTNTSPYFIGEQTNKNSIIWVRKNKYLNIFVVSWLLKLCYLQLSCHDYICLTFLLCFGWSCQKTKKIYSSHWSDWKRKPKSKLPQSSFRKLRWYIYQWTKYRWNHSESFARLWRNQGEFSLIFYSK